MNHVYLQLNWGAMLSLPVLLEAPFDPTKRRQRNSVLLTIDLTTAVADEAIARRDSVIVAYRKFSQAIH